MVGISFFSPSSEIPPGLVANGISSTPVVASPTVANIANTYAATFGGVDDCLTPELRLTGIGSISQVFAACWVKFSGTQVSKHIAGEYRTQSSHRMWRLATSPSGTTVEGQVYVNGGATTFKAYAFPTALNDGQWHHVAMYFNAGVLVLYLDGVEVATPTKRSDGTVGTIWNGIANYGIGAEGSSFVPAAFFAGDIQHARVYVGSNAIAAAANAAGVYANSYTGTPLGSYSLDQTLADASGNGYDLIDYGSIAYTLRS